MHAPKFAETPAFDDLAQCPKVGIVPPIVEDAEDDAFGFGRSAQLPSSFGIRCKRLVGDDVETCSNCLKHQFPSSFWGRCDGDGLHTPIYHTGQAVIDWHTWQIFLDRCHTGG